MENSGVVGCAAREPRRDATLINASLRQLVEEVIHRFDLISDNIDEMKTTINEIDIPHLHRLMDLDILEIEQAIERLDELDIDNLPGTYDVDEAKENSEEALSTARNLEDIVSDLKEKLESIENPDELKYLVEGFKEELDSISQRQDLMDERLCRVERIFNVVRHAVSNDPA